jgi:hypothetical protein
VTLFGKATSGDYGAAANHESWPQPRVLVLQRELLPNLSLMTSLARAGLEVVGPFNRVSQALAWIESNRPDAAVLDIALWDGASFGGLHSSPLRVRSGRSSNAGQRPSARG